MPNTDPFKDLVSVKEHIDAVFTEIFCRYDPHINDDIILRDAAASVWCLRNGFHSKNIIDGISDWLLKMGVSSVTAAEAILAYESDINDVVSKLAEFDGIEYEPDDYSDPYNDRKKSP